MTTTEVTPSNFTYFDDVTRHDAMDVIAEEMTSPVDTSIDVILVLVVIQTMLGLGCTLDVELIKSHILQPTGSFCLQNIFCLFV